jgi:hypothetical protein
MLASIKMLPVDIKGMAGQIYSVRPCLYEFTVAGKATPAEELVYSSGAGWALTKVMRPSSTGSTVPRASTY